MGKLKNLFGAVLHVERAEEKLAFEKAILRMLNDAWIDNCEDRLYFAVGEARARFNDVIGVYIREYHARTGKFPEGHHEVVSNSKRIYFAPLSSLARKRLNVSTMRSPDGGVTA